MVAVHNLQENSIMIKLNFDQADEHAMTNFAYELIETLESHGIANRITNQHIMGLFCLQRSIQVSGNKSYMSGWLNAGYRYTEHVGICTDQLDFALTLLENSHQ